MQFLVMILYIVTGNGMDRRGQMIRDRLMAALNSSFGASPSSNQVTLSSDDPIMRGLNADIQAACQRK